MAGQHPTPPRPVGEHERLRELYRRRVLGTGREQVYDDVALLARLVTGAPVALVNLLDADTAEPKAAVGVEIGPHDRGLSVCAYTVLDTLPLEIADLASDDRTRANPLLLRAGVRSYAGVPVVLGGHAVATVCVYDVEPGTVGRGAIAALQALARQTAALMNARAGRQNLGDALAQRERPASLHGAGVPGQRRRIGVTAGA